MSGEEEKTQNTKVFCCNAWKETVSVDLQWNQPLLATQLLEYSWCFLNFARFLDVSCFLWICIGSAGTSDWVKPILYYHIPSAYICILLHHLCKIHSLCFFMPEQCRVLQNAVQLLYGSGSLPASQGLCKDKQQAKCPTLSPETPKRSWTEKRATYI